MFGAPYYTEPARGMIPAWRNQADVALWEGWLGFDGIAPAPRLAQPTLVVHSEAAAIPQGAHRFFARLAAAEKAERWLDGVTQFDFYDGDAPVREASDVVAAHFAEHLSTRPAASADAHAAERARNRATVERFFAALEAKDIPAFLATWADDGVQVMPFAPEGFPSRLNGKAAIARQYGGLPDNFAFMRFPREISDMADPERFVVRYTGEIGLKAGGRYDNTYVGLFTVRSGRIAEFVEFFDPIVLREAFGTALQENFNVRR
jgi:ketosteroid isomerase-like protein